MSRPFAVPAVPRPQAPFVDEDVPADPALAAAVAEAARLAAALGDLFDRLAPATVDQPQARAAGYRIQDAAFLCRRAAEELAASGAGR